MIVKLSKDLPYQLLFAACVAVTYLNNYEITFAVWAVTALITIKKKYSLTIIEYILCFAGIFGIAFTVALFKDTHLYEYFRDVVYLLKPILGLLIGYQLCRSHNIRPFHTIIYTGLFIAVVHLGIIVQSAVIHKIVNIHVLRHYGGYFSDFEIYSLLFVLFNKQFNVRLSRRRKLMLLAIIGLSSFLYLSRTNFLQFLILYLALKGYFVINKRSVIIMGTLAALTALSYIILFNMTLQRNGKGMEAFLFKVRNAPIEAFKTRVNKNDYRDFNDNYRSYENIITVRQVSYDGVPGILFGKGMGSSVDLGRKLWTNDGEYIRYLPTLHNGFMTVFLKSGLFGLLLNLLFIYLLCRQGKTDDYYIKQINLLLFGTGIFLILANWVLLGLYLKIDNKSIIIGFILCYKEILLKQNRRAQIKDSNG